MLSIQHVMSAVLATGNDRAWLDGHMAAVVFPDAVRAYSGPRPYSHFERSADGSDVSWWKMPSDMSKVDMASVEESLTESHLVQNPPCVLGETTDLDAFRAHNGHLPQAMHDGVELHLRQDMAFDALVRERIDCSRMYEDRFSFEGSEYDGKGIRAVIADMEQQGIYVAAKRIYEEHGVVCDSKWIDERVRPVLERDYPEELARKTLSFMRIRPDIDALISARDFSHVDDGSLPSSAFDAVYGEVNRSYEQEMARRMSRVAGMVPQGSSPSAEDDFSL